MPTSRDMAIFVLMTTTMTTIRPITLPLAHAHGVKILTVARFSGKGLHTLQILERELDLAINMVTLASIKWLSVGIDQLNY